MKKYTLIIIACLVCSVGMSQDFGNVFTSGIQAISADPTPTLSADLDADGNDITDVGTYTGKGPITLESAVVGLLQNNTHNTSSASAVVVGATSRQTNDLGYFGLTGITNSGSTLGGGSFVNTFHYYNQGYGDSLFTVDGNVDFVWYSDPTDAHNYTALTNEVMRLTAAGALSLSGSQAINEFSTDGTFTVTKDTASSYNVYWETDQFKVQNKVGDDKNIRVSLYGM